MKRPAALVGLFFCSGPGGGYGEEKREEALEAHPCLEVHQGVLHLMVDGERPVMIDHMGAILEGLEMVGDE